MNTILTLILKDLRIYFSDSGNLFGLIVLPIGFTLVLGFTGGGGGGGSQRIPIDVLDLDQSPQSEQWILALRAANTALLLCPMDDVLKDVSCGVDEDGLSVEAAQDRVRSGSVRALIVIPENFGADVSNFEGVTVDYYSLASLTTGDAVLPAVQAATQQLNGAVIASQVAVDVGENFIFLGDPQPVFTDAADQTQFAESVYQQAESLLSEQPETVQYTVATANEDEPAIVDTQGFGQSVPGMGSMYVLFTVLGGMVLLLNERRDWTLQRLLTMPVSRAQILAGKMGAYFVLGMIQFGVVFAVGILVGQDFGDDPLALLLIMAAFVLSATALTFALSTRVTTEGQASGITLLLALSLAPLGGAWWPLEIVPDIMRTIGHISPVAWAMGGFREVIFFGGTLADVWVSIAVLLGLSAVLFVIGVAGFRYE